MEATFDPYHIWLGIPPEEQPPNHYRLLGVRLFESNPDVLQSAADRQMVHLRTFQTGKHSAFSQQLLNEVAGARVCLFNAAKKAAYDAQLQAQLRPERPASADGAIDPALAALLQDKSAARPSRKPTRPRLGRHLRARAVVAGAAVAVILLILALVWRGISGRDKPPLAAKPSEGQQVARPVKADGEKGDTAPAAKDVEKPPLEPPVEPPTPPSEPAKVPTPEPPVVPAGPSPPDTELGGIPEKRPTGQPPETSKPPRDPRLPVPSEQEQERAMQQARN